MRCRSFSLVVAVLCTAALGWAPCAAAQQKSDQQKPDQQKPDQQKADQQPQATQPQPQALSQSDKPGADKDAKDAPTKKAASASKQSYERLTKEAVLAYRGKDYARALSLFEQAYQVKPVPNLLYNMGRIQEKRGKFKEAIAKYEKFVTEPGVDIKARQDALDRLKTLREVVSLRDKGQKVDEEKVKNEHADRELAAPKPLKTPAAPQVERDYTAAWVTLGVAIASYGTSGFFALQARSAHSDFEDATTRAARRDAESWGQTASVVADSTLALGVVMTGLSVYFFVSPSEHEVPPQQTALRVGPQVEPHGAGVSLALDF